MLIEKLDSGNFGITGTRQEMFNIAQKLHEALFNHWNGITIQDEESELTALIHISNMEDK